MISVEPLEEAKPECRHCAGSGTLQSGNIFHTCSSCRGSGEERDESGMQSSGNRRDDDSGHGAVAIQVLASLAHRMASSQDQMPRLLQIQDHPTTLACEPSTAMMCESPAAPTCECRDTCGSAPGHDSTFKPQAPRQLQFPTSNSTRHAAVICESAASPMCEPAALYPIGMGWCSNRATAGTRVWGTTSVTCTEVVAVAAVCASKHGGGCKQCQGSGICKRGRIHSLCSHCGGSPS